MKRKTSRRNSKSKPTSPTISSRVISTLGFIIFDRPSFDNKPGEEISFAEFVKINFQNFVERKYDHLIRFVFNEVSRKKPSNNGIFVFWQEDRMKFAAAMFLYTVIPFYKYRGKNSPRRDKYAYLIIRLLDALLGNIDIIERDLIEFDLEHYWDTETVMYLRKVKELLAMTDEKFKKLDNFDGWLNS